MLSKIIKNITISGLAMIMLTTTAPSVLADTPSNTNSLSFVQTFKDTIPRTPNTRIIQDSRSKTKTDTYLQDPYVDPFKLKDGKLVRTRYVKRAESSVW